MSREMKDSGVEWIGEIPENWGVTRLKYAYDNSNGSAVRVGPFGSALPSSDYISDGEWVYNQRTVLDENFTTNNTCVSKEKADSLSGFRVYPGDILITTRGTLGHIAVVPNGAPSGILHPCIIRFRVDLSIVMPELLKYMFNDSDFFIKQIEFANNSTTIEALYSYNLRDLILPEIPITEQSQIVHFLDRKCTVIDTVIEKTKKSLKKLEEYKKAVITKAVTKGIDPNAKMKDAHFLWLTAIPEKWGIYKLNHILDYNHPYPLGDGDHGSIKADSYVSSGIPFIRVQNLGYAEPINIENVVYITEAQNQKIQNSTLAPNDILFAKTGATIGKTAIMPQTISRANTTSHIGKITVDTRYYVPKYIFYALSSEIGNHQLWSIANKKATRPEVGLDEVKYIKLCIPLSVTEQKQIADFLDEKLNQINNAISNHANLIRKLEEYKKSLIYYAVTGKIDCRNEVI